MMNGADEGGSPQGYPGAPQQPMMMHPQTQFPQDGMSPAKAAALVSAGSALGLTAAAAFRWLNGGDFELLPTAGRAAETEALRLKAAQELRAEQRDRQATNEVQNERLSTHFKSLVDSLQSHTQQNEKIVQRLTSLKESRMTDESMDLLRNQELSNTSSTAVFLKLAEIQAELSSLRRDMVALQMLEKSDTETSKTWEARLSTTMNALDTCLADIHPLSRKTSPPRSTIRTERTVLPSTPATSNTSLETSSSATVENLSLLDAMEKLLRENTAKNVRKGAQVLYLFAVNLSTQPNSPRYRKIYTSNSSYQTIAPVTGATDILKAVGFVERDEGKYLEWVPKKEGLDEEHYSIELQKAAVGLGVLKSPMSRPVNELLQVVRGALAAEERRLRPSDQATPKRSNESSLNDSASDILPPHPHTPDVGSIVSPPVTRKQPFIPATDLARLMEHPSSSQAQQMNELPPPPMLQSTSAAEPGIMTTLDDVRPQGLTSESSPLAITRENEIGLHRDISSVASSSSDEEKTNSQSPRVQLVAQTRVVHLGDVSLPDSDRMDTPSRNSGVLKPSDGILNNHNEDDVTQR